MGIETCETVVIKTVNGPVIINKSDFVEGENELYTEEPEKAEETVSTVETTVTTEEPVEETPAAAPIPVKPWEQKQ